MVRVQRTSNDVSGNGGGDLALGSSYRGQHHVNGENDYESSSLLKLSKQLLRHLVCLLV